MGPVYAFRPASPEPHSTHPTTSHAASDIQRRERRTSPVGPVAVRVPARPIRPRSCRSPSLVVAIARRRRPVHVRLLDGPPDGGRARARRSARTRPSSRSGTRTTRSPTATPAATSTATPLVQGAIRGMIEALGDPYSSYLTLGGVPDQRSRASAASSRASAPRSRRRRADGTPGLRDARRRLPAGHRRAARRARRREGRAAGRATWSSRSTACRSTA